MLPLEIRVVLVALAVFRLASLFSQDEGPARIFLRLRLWIGRNAADEAAFWRAKGYYSRPGLWANLGELVHCPYCLGVWFGLLGVVALLFPSLPGDLLAAWWGLSGAQALFEGFAGRSR